MTPAAEFLHEQLIQIDALIASCERLLATENADCVARRQKLEELHARRNVVSSLWAQATVGGR